MSGKTIQLFASDHFSNALHRLAKLEADDHVALNELPFERLSISASSYIVREGQIVNRCAFLASGITMRQKMTISGDRAIVGINLPGEFLDLQHLFLGEADHDIVAIKHSVIMAVSADDLRSLVLERPAIGRALWVATLIEGSICREWLRNATRRDSKAAAAHLICELWYRLNAANLGPHMKFKLPLTQEQMADALGITSVHLNRMLRLLQQEGLIKRHKKEMAITDWSRLVEISEFSERYLHMDATQKSLSNR